MGILSPSKDLEQAGRHLGVRAYGNVADFSLLVLGAHDVVDENEVGHVTVSGVLEAGWLPRPRSPLTVWAEGRAPLVGYMSGAAIGPPLPRLTFMVAGVTAADLPSGAWATAGKPPPEPRAQRAAELLARLRQREEGARRRYR